MNSFSTRLNKTIGGLIKVKTQNLRSESYFAMTDDYSEKGLFCKESFYCLLTDVKCSTDIFSGRFQSLDYSTKVCGINSVLYSYISIYFNSRFFILKVSDKDIDFV